MTTYISGSQQLGTCSAGTFNLKQLLWDHSFWFNFLYESDIAELFIYLFTFENFLLHVNVIILGNLF